MKEGHLERLLREAGTPGLMDVLVKGLSPTDLQSLLQEVYKRRADGVSPARLAEQYAEDRFVRPSEVKPQDMLEVEQLAFAQACPPFEALDLSPVCPLGVVSVLGDVSQNWVLPTTRNKEVVADPTNCLALECAVRRKQGETVRLCASHRVLRTQVFKGAGSFAHFKVFGLCTAGKDEGNLAFEMAALKEHLTFHVGVLLALRDQDRPISKIRILLTDLESLHADQLRRDVVDPLTTALPELDISFAPERQAGRGYYDRFCFEIRTVADNGVEASLVDGGFTDWTAKLLSNQKERLMISGIGLERVATLLAKR